MTINRVFFNVVDVTKVWKLWKNKIPTYLYLINISQNLHRLHKKHKETFWQNMPIGTVHFQLIQFLSCWWLILSFLQGFFSVVVDKQASNIKGVYQKVRRSCALNWMRFTHFAFVLSLVREVYVYHRRCCFHLLEEKTLDWFYIHSMAYCERKKDKLD